MNEAKDFADEPLGDDAACADAIQRIGALERELSLIATRKDRAVAAATVEAEAKATPAVEERDALAKRVEAYCAVHRARLTDSHRSKTARFTTGECQWTMTRGRVLVEPALKKAVLDRVKAIGKGFIRVKEELDLTAIGAAFRDGKAEKLKRVKGLAFEEGREAFSVKPAGAELVERPEAA